MDIIPVADDGLELLTKRLQARGHRVTDARKTILNLINNSHARFTAAELLDQVQQVDPGIGRATVFRTLDVLCELGILQRVHLDDRSCHSYVFCGRSHHHHLVCSNCGDVIEFAQGEIEELLHRIAERVGFKLASHHLEVQGNCQRCAVKSA